MKFVSILLLIICIGFVVMVHPLFQATLACYDSSTESFDDIGFRKNSRGLNEQEVCIARSEIIGQLDTCLIKANPSEAGKMVSPYLLTGISIIRPSFIEVKILKADHNTNCQAYPDALF